MVRPNTDSLAAGLLASAFSARGPMQGEKKERWMQLCAQATVEQDPQKLIELVQEINALLEEKERRLGIAPPSHNPKTEN
jgi:hypothetical protein